MKEKQLWSLLLVGFLSLWLAACTTTPDTLPDADSAVASSPSIAFPVIMAGAQGASAAEAAAEQVTPKATADTLLAQVRKSLYQTATPTAPPIPTAVPSVTPLPSPTPCASPGRIVQGEFDNTLTAPLTYRVYLPPCYEQRGLSYPTLYMLPGNIYTDSIWDELGLDEAAERGISSGQYAPFMIIMVSGGYLADSTSGGPGSYESLLVDEFIPYIEQTYCAWPSRDGRAVGGMSRGGYWALEIAFRHSDFFGSVGGHSAALLDSYGGPEINPEFTGLANDLGDLRMYFDIGQDDWVINNIQSLHEGMAAAGIDHEWVLNDGRHEEAYWGGHVADYLTFYSALWKIEDYPRCRAPLATPTP